MGIFRGLKWPSKRFFGLFGDEKKNTRTHTHSSLSTLSLNNRFLFLLFVRKYIYNFPVHDNLTRQSRKVLKVAPLVQL